MCGIAGIIHLNGQQVDETRLQKMGLFMQNRGPDHTGAWTGNNVGFLHKRLSIIDLSAGGHQPMLDPTGQTVITFNGEIYNFPGLKKELQSLGRSFHTSSDTEVILQGYLAWGIDKLLEKLDGMFAFGLYDTTNEKLFLCRDRFGKKPLYYAFAGKNVFFASDIRSIVAQIEQKELDYGSLDFYLSELSVPQPKTIWKGIEQVYKSSFLTLDLRSGHVAAKTYWKIDPFYKIRPDYSEAEKLVEESLTQAILKRTLSDVPIGSFLSGGIDSGLIVSLLAQNSSSRIKTFTVGFSEEDFNELPLAKQVADRYHTEHTELHINPRIEDEITDLVNYFGEPFADSSAIPTYYICREMKKHVTVALSGDGGDELFGYPNYAYLYNVDEFAHKYKTGFGRDLAALLSKITSRFGATQNYGSLNMTYRQQKTGRALIRGMAFMPEDMRKLYRADFLQQEPDFTLEEVKKIWSRNEGASLTDTVFAASLDTRLLNDYLVKVDRASMKNSMEVRSPFLDTQLAQLAFSLPNEYKIHEGSPKYLLKKLAQKHVDENIFSRKKQGFGIPVKHWLKKELKPMVDHYLSVEQINKRGFFNAAYVRQIIAEHRQDKGNHTHKVWSLLWLEMWCQQNLD